MKFVLMFAIFWSVSVSHAFDAPKVGDAAADPVAYTLAHTEFPEGGARKFDCAGCTAMKDVIFIASVSECGNSGCTYLMFRPSGTSNVFLTSLFLNPNGFQILKTTHKGLNDIRSYRHLSAEEGELATFEFDGVIYRQKGKARIINSSQFEKSIQPEKVETTEYSGDGKKL